MDLISTKRRLVFSEDGLHALRQIVQRQKAEVAKRERASSSVLLASAENSIPAATLAGPDHSALPVNRKVAECSSPPAYRGFSSVIHISREGNCHSAQSAVPQADPPTLSRKIAHPASARSSGMITASDWRLGNQLIQKFFGGKNEQSTVSPMPLADHTARTVQETRPEGAKDADGGETAVISARMPDDGPQSLFSMRHSLEEGHSNSDAPCLVGQKRPAATSGQDSARKHPKSGQRRQQQQQQHHNPEQPMGTRNDRCAAPPVPDREALRALVRQQRKERQEKRQRELEAAEMSRARIAQNLQLTAQKAAAAAARSGRHGPPPPKPSFGAWNDTATSQPNECLPSLDAVTRSSEFPAVALHALGASNSNTDVVGESGRLRLLTMSGDRVPSELARRASELLAEAEDSVHAGGSRSRDDAANAKRGRTRPPLKSHARTRKLTDGQAPATDTANAIDRTVRGRRLPSPPHLNGHPPASSALRVANSLSADVQAQHSKQGVPCSAQAPFATDAQSTPLCTFTHAVRDRPSEAIASTNRSGAADSGHGGRPSVFLTKDASTVEQLRHQRAAETAAGNATGTAARHTIIGDRINSLHENGDHDAHRRYLAALSARTHAHFARADPCTEEALCKTRISANRTRRLLNLSCAPKEAVGDAAASDSESPFTPSTDDESLDIPPGGGDGKWFCLEASSDEVGSADDDAAVVSDQLCSLAEPRRPPCHTSGPALRASGPSPGIKNSDGEATRNTDFQFEPDPLRFMSVYRQKRHLAAPAPDPFAHVCGKPQAEVAVGDTEAFPEVPIQRPSSRTLGDGTASHHHRELETTTSTVLETSALTKFSQNSSGLSTTLTSKSRQTAGAKNLFVGRLPPAPTGPPRLTAAALGLSLTANVNRLDALATSIEQLQGMESLRQLSLAQAESVSLAQLFQCGQVKESLGIDQPACAHRQSPELNPSNQNHRTVKEESSRPVVLPTPKPAAVTSASLVSSQNESTAAVISTSISGRQTSNSSSSRIIEVSHTARTSSAQDSTLHISSANGSVILESDVGAVSEAVQSVAEISNSRHDLGISTHTSRQTSITSQETAPKERKSQSAHHIFPKASPADKSLNTTNDLLTAIEALDQPVGETSKPHHLAKVEKAVDASDQILRLNSEDYKGLYKLRAEELRRRKHKAQLVMLLSERLALQESEVVQLESQALQSLRRKLAEPPKLTPPLVSKAGGVRTPVSRRRAAFSHKKRASALGDSTEPEEESVSGAAILSSNRLKLSADQEEVASVSVSVTVPAATSSSSTTTASSISSAANDYATTAGNSSSTRRSGESSLPNASGRSANDTDAPSPRAILLSARDLSVVATADATGQDAASTARTSASAAAAAATYSTGSFIEESSTGRPPRGSCATTPRSASSATLTPEHIIDLHSSTSARTLTPRYETGIILSARALSPPPSANKTGAGEVSQPPQRRPTGSGDELSTDSLDPEISTASGLSHRERRISTGGTGASECDSSAAAGSSLSQQQQQHRRRRRDKESRLCARPQTEAGSGGDCEWRSQLYAMIDNLVKQERLLARLDRSGSGGNKHELKRLAKTLSKHRQMCTQIIERIHSDLVAHYSREGFVGGGDDGSHTSLSLRPLSDNVATGAMVLSPSALLAEVAISTSSRSSERLSQPTTVVAELSVASSQRDRQVKSAPITASIVDVCPAPSAVADADLLSLSAGSHRSGEEQETAESPTSLLSEYSVSIDDQTPGVSRPQTTMSKIPSYRTSPEDLESESESRLAAAATTTHGTVPTPVLADARVPTPSPRDGPSSAGSSMHEVLDLATPHTSTSHDQKEVSSVSDNLKQRVIESSPRDSVKLSTPQPASQATSTADLPLSEADVLDRPLSSASVEPGVQLTDELKVPRPQSATPSSVLEEARGGSSSGTLTKQSVRTKSAGSEVGPFAPNTPEALGSHSELLSVCRNATGDIVPKGLEARNLSMTDEASTKSEIVENADGVASVLSTPSDRMFASNAVSTEERASAASKMYTESPPSTEPSQRVKDAPSAAEDHFYEGSKIASPVVTSPALQHHVDTAVEHQPAVIADAGSMYLGGGNADFTASTPPATSTVDECTLLMAEECAINEVSITDDDDEDEGSDSACQRILQLSFSPRADFFDGVSSPAAKSVEGLHLQEAQPLFVAQSPRSPPLSESPVAKAATPSAPSPHTSISTGQLGNKVGSPVGPSARKPHRSKENGSAQMGKSTLLDTLISPTPVLSESEGQPQAALAALSSPPTAALAKLEEAESAPATTAGRGMGAARSKRSSPSTAPSSSGVADATTATRMPCTLNDTSNQAVEAYMAGVSGSTRHALAAVATSLFNELLNNAITAVLVQDAGLTNAPIKPNKIERQKTSPAQQMEEEAEGEKAGQLNGELSPKHTVVLKPTDEFFRTINREIEEELSEETVSSASDETSSDDASVGEPAPVGLPPEAVRGLIANTPGRIHSLVTSALQHFWSFRSTNDGGFEAALRNAQPPKSFLAEYSDEEDVALAASGQPVTFVNRMLVYEYLRELLLRIYAGEDEERRSNVKPVITSSQFRLWKGLSRPTSLERLSSLVASHLQSDLALNLQQSSLAAPVVASPSTTTAAAAAASQIQRMPKLTQWTLSRKNWLDQLLELEMRADEATWINYAAYEEEIKQGLVTQVLDELLENAVCTVFEAAKDLVDVSNGNQPFSPDSSRSRNPSSVISVA